MIETLAERIAIQLKSINPHETKSVPTMKFGLILIINMLLIITISLTLSLMIGTFPGTLITLAGFLVLRQFSGGFHYSSSVYCTMTSIVGAVLIPLVPFPIEFVTPIIIITLVLVALFAPQEMEMQSRLFKQNQTLLLKTISIIIVSLLFFIESETLVKTFFVQALTLIPLKGGGKDEK
ncbi:accessory gene regulator ArgB-like protein [Brevibacillus sp. DP1.3A]|uniref:accessory gene regulator ArgB-like protein n=1 Tax=Brevibacillus sp. DP1.3A TaxID=2738867 RepID=UPI00156ABF7B|nr:accessory gene regulator B family protein [Brevibacillus sp. DP1.3A]UED76942.1 accessory gene regulator B family protein [Brevibacillus sp. DP1.3A]